MSFSSKPLMLSEIKEVVESLGNLLESSLEAHSLALVIGNSGEATFTRCGWKLLLEAGFNSPTAKIIVNCAKSYTTSCGEDCKYFLFVLKEMISTIHTKVHGNDEAYMRVKFINEISSLKHMLPCIFNSIVNISGAHVTSRNPYSFSKELSSIVETFMLLKFSAAAAKHLSSLIYDFIQSINYERNSLKVILDYVITHFDLFCFKALASLSESRVIRGFIFHRKCISPHITLENTKFIIIYDMSMKSICSDVSWNISDETFVCGLNEYDLYHKVFSYFKDRGIKLIITPCAGDKNLKLLCDENCIILLDRAEKEEIDHILCCLELTPLEKLNEEIESKHVGELKYLKSFLCNNSYFLNMLCSNSPRLLNAHNILLTVPVDALWKEYYLESLNCLKVVSQWLSSSKADCTLHECLDKSIPQLVNINCVCSHLEMSFIKSLKLNEIINSVLEYQDVGIAVQNHISVKESHQDIGTALKIPNSVLKPYQDINIAPQTTNSVLEPHQEIGTATQITNPVLKPPGVALPPGLWELLFQTSLKEVSKNLSLPCRNIIQILHFTIVKLTCKKIGLQFCKVADLQDAYHVFFERSMKSNESFLEPIVCKEIMIYSVLDLILQLLKIDGIVSSK